jgi:predicted phosphohydrolase
VHAGDVASRGSIPEVIDFLEWFSKLPYTYKIFIAGNHDFAFERYLDVMTNLLQEFPDVIYLQDSDVTVDGIKFYGSPWQPEFYNWAFNLPRGKRLAEKWAMIPDDTDVLITHGPPMTDSFLDFTAFDKINVGCEELMKRVKEVKPKIHAFGHIHEGYGYKELDGTTFINASTCTLNYQPTNAPVVVDFDGKSAEFVTS